MTAVRLGVMTDYHVFGRLKRARSFRSFHVREIVETEVRTAGDWHAALRLRARPDDPVHSPLPGSEDWPEVWIAEAGLLWRRLSTGERRDDSDIGPWLAGQRRRSMHWEDYPFASSLLLPTDLEWRKDLEFAEVRQDARVAALERVGRIAATLMVMPGHGIFRRSRGPAFRVEKSGEGVVMRLVRLDLDDGADCPELFRADRRERAVEFAEAWADVSGRPFVDRTQDCVLEIADPDFLGGTWDDVRASGVALGQKLRGILNTAGAAQLPADIIDAAADAIEGAEAVHLEGSEALPRLALAAGRLEAVTGGGLAKTLAEAGRSFGIRLRVEGALHRNPMEPF